jgi:hypothetical protein
MIADELKLLLASKHGKFNFNALISYMEDSDIVYVVKKLHRGLGMTTVDMVIIDTTKLSKLNDSLIYFCILHETAHAKQIKKIGFYALIKILSNDIFDELFEHFIKEEIRADRYASLMFYKLTGIQYPIEFTQQLNLPYRREDYKNVVKLVFGKIKDKDSYYEVMNNFIIE